MNEEDSTPKQLLIIPRQNEEPPAEEALEGFYFEGGSIPTITVILILNLIIFITF